jgi:hypothetical protein
MKAQALLAVFSGLVAASSFACGSTVVTEPAPAPAATTPDPTPAPTAPAAPATPALDHGAVSTTYPAFAPAVGQLANHGGSVLKSPVIVTITWPSDTDADAFETLGDKIGKGSYWKAVTSEYGAGAGVSGAENHVRITDAAPATISDTEINTFVAAQLTKADAPWPTPATGDPVYIMYLSPSTDLLLSGKSACKQGVGGYHDSTKVNGKSVAYAVVPRCQAMEDVTLAASHELAEAATDPYPRTKPAWTGFVDESLAWDFFQQFQSENGDACEFYRDSMLSGTETDVGFAVQRQWSNASGKAGHDPCVPAIAGQKYFSVTPLDLEDIDVDLSSIGGSTATTKGYKVKVGATKTVPLGFYSDGPINAWDIKTIAGGITGGFGGGSSSKGNLDLSLDVTTGQNGQKAYLTVTVNSAGRTGAQLVTVVSTRGSVSHYMPILIGQ